VGFLRTVLGDIPSSDAGVFYAHEHIIIDPSFTTFCYPDFLIDSVEKAVVDVGEFRAAGGKTLVDSMPCGGGRNASKLAEVARRTGANILCPTGLHLAKYYAPGHWGERLSAEELTELFLEEIEEGIDAFDLNGPTIQRTPCRAGLIKVATGESGFTPREEKIFEAAVAAHRSSGAPILTHTEQGEWGLEQVEFLCSLGANLGHVVLSHTDRKPDPGYHKELLSTGVMLEYDSAFRWKAEQGNPTVDLLVEMFASGYGGQILLGMDAARRSYWRAYGGKPGLAFLLKEFVPQLNSRGLSQSDIDSIFIENPARCYSFDDR
jgi:predicted metal-dependent phosphotriesterase family hydrolase